MRSAAAASAVVALAVIAAGSGAAAARELTVRTFVQPTSVGVGDPFVARVDVTLARGVDADAVRVDIDPGPFSALGAPSLEHLQAGGGALVRTTQRLACLEVECAPEERARAIVLPPARVRLATSGGVITARGRRAIVHVVPRVPAMALEASNPPFRRTTRPAAPTYTASPELLAAAGLTASVLLALLAVAAAAAGARRGGRRRPFAVDPLARAIRLVRESAGRSTADRRRAAGLLARVLAERGTAPLARRAAALAWSAPPPAPSAAELLARAAEGTVAPAAGEERR